MKIERIIPTSNVLVWLIYLLLLGVLLPHTAWAFGRFEPAGFGIVAWLAAFAFEAAIAVLTHKLAKQIEAAPKRAKGWAKFSGRYVNAYGAGLSAAWAVSTLANLAHSVEFGQGLKIFAQWGIPAWAYAVAFGAILPTCSLLFARILSNVIEANDSETEANPELDEAKRAIRELRERLRQAEQERNDAETRFRAAGDIFARLTNGPKQERILAVIQRYPALPLSAVAMLTDTSVSYVSEVKSENGAQSAITD